jgi:hypothetical protein
MSSSKAAGLLLRVSIVSLGAWSLGAVAAPVPGYAAADVSEVRAVGAFDRVEVSGAFKTEITAGREDRRVTISGNRAELDKVTTNVKDRTLVVGMRDDSRLNGELLTVTIALPILRGFTNSGFGSVKIGGLTGADIDIDNAGAASVVVAGRSGRETIELNGAGKIDATEVDAKDVEVDNNGVGVVDVRASGSLDMSVNGLGMIRYTGSPSHVESHVNGVGRIQRI